MLHILASEQAAVVGVINPVSQGAGTVTTGWIAARTFLHYLAILHVGALGTSATVDAKLQQASDASGTGAKDVTGKAITQLTQAGTDANKQVLIDLGGEELDVNNSFSHFRLSVTVAVAASLIAGTVLGVAAKYGAASDHDASTVDEIVT